jgi:hypothetical protein
MIDPEFWVDEKVLTLSVPARLFFIGLWNFADDEGYLKGSATKLKAWIFPYDFTILEVSGFLDELIKSGILTKEDELLCIVNFQKHQYIKKKMQTIKEKREKFRKVRKSIEHSTPIEVEVEVKGSEVKGRSEITSLTPKAQSRFETVWQGYPNKDGRKAAEKYFKSSVKSDIDFHDIQIALSNYLNSKPVRDGFIKNGATWFNNWRDWIVNPVATEEPGARLKALIEQRTGEVL